MTLKWVAGPIFIEDVLKTQVRGLGKVTLMHTSA